MADSFSKISALIHISCIVLALGASAAEADVVTEAVAKVSSGQYRVYQVEIQDMGLGLYGGPAYNQGYRNRDGWAVGVARFNPKWIEGGTPGNLEARLYLVDQLAGMGLSVSRQGLYQNVVGEVRGTDRPDEIYVVCGHYDTTSNGERPGGDDNASGTAGMLEVARVLTQYEPGATLRFIGFNAEEDWMLGSQEYVNSVVVPRKERVLGVLNLDMILRPGWDGNPLEAMDLDIGTGTAPACIAWAQTFIGVAGAYAPSLIVDPLSPDFSNWNAGDQGPFIAAGIPALMITEATAPEIWWRNSNSFYHQPGDASDGPANDPQGPSGITYDYDFATDVVRATVATLAQEAGIAARPRPGFVEYQAMETFGVQDFEPFSLGGDQYLAIANGDNDLTHDVSVNVYRWDGSVFVPYQAIPSHGASDCEFFTVGDRACLAVANMRDDATHDIDSKLYAWDGQAFAEFQPIATHGASDCEFFSIGDESYLAIANSGTDTTADVNSVIYRWNGVAFAEFQTLATHGAADCEFFAIAGDSFLAVANARDDATYNVKSRIYRWNGKHFSEWQAIATQGATDWEFFAIGDAAFLAVANGRSGATHNVDSRIYKWDGNAFVSHQFVPTQGAADWEAFSIGEESYLAVANEVDDTASSTRSRIYRWNGARMVEQDVLPSHGTRGLKSFRMGEVVFLAVADCCDDATHNMNSILYRYSSLAAGDQGK